MNRAREVTGKSVPSLALFAYQGTSNNTRSGLPLGSLLVYLDAKRLSTGIGLFPSIYAPMDLVNPMVSARLQYR